ncbi:glycosyltransferase [Candidatus Halobeggiatoa sp. HSG11]|nr:glycosyltransferase [Candidatus Halobeggiatoa sp. HSG11]
MPNFSVIIPLYNKVKSIKAALDSVLAQTETSFEIIVVDDGSSDGSSDIVAAIPSIRLIRQSNAGVSAARNRGIAEAQSDYLAFLDADDYWKPDFLQHIYSLIQRYPQAGAFATAYELQQGEQRIAQPIHSLGKQALLIEDYFAVASRGNLPLTASSVCIPRTVLDKVGGFPTEQKQGEDQDLWARIGLFYPIALHPAVAVRYIVSADNRVSVNCIPQQELAFSSRLQMQLEQGQIPESKRQTVARYIAGHLVHIAQLNVRHGQTAIARRLLADPRCNLVWQRKLKWWLLSFLSWPTKPKIVHLLNDTDMGGIKSVIDSLAASYLANDYQFEFICLKPTFWWRKPYHARIIMIHYASNWRTLPSLLCLRLCNPGAKILLQEHHYTAAFEQTVPSPSRFRQMLRLNYLLVNQVIAVSQGQAKWLACLLAQKKLTVIPQSRQLDSFLTVTKKTPTLPLVLGAYGRFHWQKGFDTLLEVMRRLPDLQLRLGGNGEQESQLRELASGLSNVTFCGPLHDVPGFLQGCDVIVIPSRFEPFGLVCLEARAAGRGVVVTDVDGLPEQAKDCGLIVKADDQEALYQALHSLTEQPLQRWGENARDLSRDSWTVYLQRWQSLLSRC